MSEPAVARLLANQRARWAVGDCVLVEAYVQQHPALLTDAEGLLDLIYNEVFLREQKGETPGREEYVRRFPQLAGPINEQFDQKILNPHDLRSFLGREAGVHALGHGSPLTFACSRLT